MRADTSVGDLVGIELVTQLDEPSRRPPGQADEGVGEGLAVLLVDVDGDQRSASGLGRSAGDLAHRSSNFFVVV